MVACTPLHCTPLIPDPESLAFPLTVTGDDVTVAPSVGLAMVTTGGVVSRITDIDAVTVLPATSVAVTWIVFDPEANGTEHEYVEPLIEAVTPLH